MTTSPFAEPALVPELLVTSLETSLAFWRDLCGFEIRYGRTDEGFAYITRGGAHLMLDELGIGRDWISGPLEQPLGRGLNLQVSVVETAPILATLAAAGWPLFMDPESTWYRTGENESGVEQFLVQDPDGYLVRFQAHIGTRAIG